MALTNEEKLAREQQQSFSTIIPVITESVVQHNKGQKGKHENKNNSTSANSSSQENEVLPVRRGRGRPRIIKDYHDPMKSPMASTSLKVQRQGFLDKGGKTVMKIGSVMSFASPSKTNIISQSQSANSISSYNTPKRLTVGSKNDTSPTLDKKVKRAGKTKASPKKVVKSVSTGNVSSKLNSNSQSGTGTKLSNSTSNGDIQAVLKYMNINSTAQKTPTRSRKGSVTASTNNSNINKDLITNSSVSELKKKRSRKNSLLYNSQLDTPYNESRNRTHDKHSESRQANIDTPSSITSTTRKQMSKLSLKLDKNGRAYIEKIDENDANANSEMGNGPNHLEAKFVSVPSLGVDISANDHRQQFVSMYETQNGYQKDKATAENKSFSKTDKQDYLAGDDSVADKDIDMGSNSGDGENNLTPTAEYLNWNNPLLQEKSLNDDDKKKVLSLLKRFNTNSNLLQNSPHKNVADEKKPSNATSKAELEDIRIKTPPLSQSAQFTTSQSNQKHTVLQSNSALKLNTDEMEIAIPALLELSPMNMSILNKTPNGKLNYSSMNSLGNVNMTNPHLNSASKFFPMGSPFSTKYKQLGIEDYDYQKFFSMSPNNKEHVTLSNHNLNKTPNITSKDNNNHSLGMMFNLDSVLQSPNNNIFQAFSQAVYSSPLAVNNGNRLQNPINLDLKNNDYGKNDHMANEDFFKTFNPIKLNTNAISRSPRIIIENNKKPKENSDGEDELEEK